ncbi:MAG: hypothetical protein DME68_09685, partial [Verrucomicrobia bacterium]
CYLVIEDELLTGSGKLTPRQSRQRLVADCGRPIGLLLKQTESIGYALEQLTRARGSAEREATLAQLLSNVQRHQRLDFPSALL